MQENVTKNYAKLAINKSLLKEYNNSSERIVYLEDGTEFQIQLFNPLSVTIGASISINGKDLSNRLIIKPGERIWLERYFDSPDKFIFSTYTVNGNNSEVKEAIKSNGIITIKFYKEKERHPIQIVSNPIWVYNDNYTYPQTYEYTTTCDNTSALKSSNIKNGLNSCINHNSNISSVNFCSSELNNISGSISSAATTATTASYSASTCTLDTVDNTLSLNCNKQSEKKIETGRIERGSHSNQSFDYVNIDFEYWSFRTESIHIFPMSQKQYSSSDLEKKYCSECGRKIKDKFKYCPFCGNKL